MVSDTFFHSFFPKEGALIFESPKKVSDTIFSNFPENGV